MTLRCSRSFLVEGIQVTSGLARCSCMRRRSRSSSPSAILGPLICRACAAESHPAAAAWLGGGSRFASQAGSFATAHLPTSWKSGAVPTQHSPPIGLKDSEIVPAIRTVGFAAPSWSQFARYSPAREDHGDDKPADFTRGWQWSASRAVASAASLTGRLGDPDTGRCGSPSQARVLPNSLQHCPPRQNSFRVLLLRHLRLQLPLVPATCPCRRRLDALGDHRASCPRSGLLRPRAIPLREVGATVSTNVLLRDPNLVVERQDDRSIEVIASGLQLWGGAQLAVDTTLVSALYSAGQPQRSTNNRRGLAPCPSGEGANLPRVALVSALPSSRPWH